MHDPKIGNEWPVFISSISQREREREREGERETDRYIESGSGDAKRESAWAR